MSYGIEIRNTDGDLVLDEENEVVLVAEKGTISGVRTSIPLRDGNPSIYGDAEGQWWDSGPNYLSTIYLANSYSEPPIVAVRGQSGAYNILTPASRVFASVDGGDIDRVFLRSEVSSSIDYIVCANASACPAASRSVGSAEYGLTIDNSASETIFDSRWASIVSCTNLADYPDGVDVEMVYSPGVPAPFNYTASKTTQDVTIRDTPGAFITTTSLNGFISFYHGTTSGQGGEPVENYGGGYFMPSLVQTSDTNIKATTINIGDGPPAIGQPIGSEFNRSTLRGNFLVLRYLGF